VNLIRLRMKGYIQPFERRLAMQELRTLSNAEPKPVGLPEDGGVQFELKSIVSKELLANRLAFWECVEGEGQEVLTAQSLRESTVHTARNGVSIRDMGLHLPFEGHVPLPNRRCLRYGPHGIHEYRGKFFPQLVRSLINISGVSETALVADPMSGSGTTVVEAVLSGRRAVGLDMNPLSVFLARTKCNLLGANAAVVARSYEVIRQALESKSDVRKHPRSYFAALPESDQAYLRAWFSPKVLSDLDQVMQGIEGISDSLSRELMRISVSNVLRRVSWQKPDDLRVRKEIRDDTDIDARKEFLNELERSVRSVLAFLYQNGRIAASAFEVREADARNCGDLWEAGSVDLVITSPPYATALPYLDTDRLSLCYLGLLPRPEHRERDQQMIGNREITETLRRQYWERFEKSVHALPKAAAEVINRIAERNSRASVGFRRRNLPPLLAKYFFDMQRVIEGIHTALRPGSFAFVVVGNNHTVAGNERVEIETATYLQEIARSVGFRVAQSLQMEMLVSRDIFKRNASRSEEILALYKNP
jgi:site-specific DNA-methyltransferase (cytosine-N4-specific)